MERETTLGLATLLSLLGAAVDDAVLRALDGTGLRRGHGYVVQRLLVGPATATQVAAELGVSQQAVSKVLKELMALGHVELVADDADRRSRPVRLTTRGREAVHRARAVRADIDARVAGEVGTDELAAAHAVLVAALDVLGIREQVERRTVAPQDGRLG
ncbi:DNA-binding MarR family transcriptional regulator [Motilibacter peucedani]|uniref:DNA-binding MarR family transcriptional regulator n=1 Tax=Motilibacter peucedani TaxID=598650 RepID=A0A420XQQ7_9ACTN|nr:MarR family winged helix-turn-helix transcriptional regulator [Motilibacter peucedani]RKS75585.1 DNA-binding MarR family transcriptional regulator [Motilibacter peucedani]